MESQLKKLLQSGLTGNVHENDINNEAMSRNMLRTRKKEENETFDEFVLSLKALSKKDSVLKENLELNECINLYKSLEEEEQKKEFMEVESLEVNALSGALEDCEIENHIKQFNLDSSDGCSEGDYVFNDVEKLETSADYETVTSDVLEDHAEYLDETLLNEEECFQPRLEFQPDENAALEDCKIKTHIKQFNPGGYDGCSEGEDVFNDVEQLETSPDNDTETNDMSEDHAEYLDETLLDEEEGFQPRLEFQPEENASEMMSNAHESRIRRNKEKDGTREEFGIQDSLQGNNISLSCRAVRIGSYIYIPKEKVHIAPKGIKIVAPSLKNESRDVALEIQLNEVVRISVYFYGKKLPVICLYTQFKCGAYIRRALDMSEESELYFDPGSKHDSNQRIILFPEKLTKESKVALQSLFGELLIKLTPSEANEIIVETFSFKANTPVTETTTMSASAPIASGTKETTTMSASASSASGTKCSNPAEIRRMVIYPPINTEANTCLAQDHGSDRRIKAEIITLDDQGSLQANVTHFSCWLIRIGSYGFISNEKVRISSNVITIMAPSLKNKSVVPLQIQLNEVVRGSVHYGIELLVIFLFTQLKCGAYIRKALGMSEESGPYYDPGSKHDSYQRIILFLSPSFITKQAKDVLQSLFGELLTEMTFREANKILIRIFDPIRKPVTNMTTRSASYSIASGTKCSISDEMSQVPINSPDKDGSREEIIQGSLQGVVTSLSCYTVTIGSYRYTPKQKVHISSEGIKIVALCGNKNEFRAVELQIQLKEVLQILVQYGIGLPIIFLFTQFECGTYIRRALEMSEDSGLYYDPASKHDLYKKIILFPENVSEEAKVVLQSLFGKRLGELTTREANQILLKTFSCEDVPKITTISASASIASGTKCTDGSKEEIIQSSPQEMVTSLSCNTVRIGSYKYEPKEKVHISSNGIQIVAPSLKDGCRDVALQIQLKEVVGISVHYSKPLQVIFLDTLIKCGDYIRRALEMSEESGLYFDPGSKRDPYQRITLLPKGISEEAKVVLNSLFGKLLNKLSSIEAKENLIRMYCSTKCSNPAIIKRIPIGPPDKGGIPITTEAHPVHFIQRARNDVSKSTVRVKQNPGEILYVRQPNDRSRLETIRGSLERIVTSLSCRTVTIGSYRYIANKEVLISSKGIQIVAPSLKTECEDVELKIPLNEVLRISLYYDKWLSIIFLYTRVKCSAYIRKALEMSEESGLYYDPASKHDLYKRIILFPGKVSEEAKVVLQSLFGKRLSEITTREANEILIKTFYPKENTPVTIPASASIASGTKCSSPAEISRIPIDPPDKGGIPITTEAHTSLAQDHGGDGSKEEIIQGSLQGNVMSLSCRTVRIGSYRYTPKEKVHISSRGVKIVAPSLKNGCRDVVLQIQLKEVVRVSVHYGKGLLVIFMYTLIRCGAYIRRALEMSEESGLYFDPRSKHEPYKRIILFPKEISEEAKVVLQSLFGKLLNELSCFEAMKILVNTCAKQNTRVTEMTMTTRSSASIASGSEYSNPAEIRKGKGDIPINTETYTCLAQDHGGEEEKSENTDDVNADYVNTDDVTTYFIKTEKFFEDSASVGKEEKSGNTDDVNADYVNTDDVTTYFIKTKEFFEDSASVGKEEKSENTDDVNADYVNTDDVTTYFIKTEEFFEDSASFSKEEKSKNTDDVNADYVNTDDVTTYFIKTEEFFEDSASVGEEEKSENTDDVNADYVNTNDVTTYSIKTKERFEDSASVGDELEPRPETPHRNNSSGVPMSCMESLPDELLLSNSNLTGNAVESSDSLWKMQCSKDFGNIEEAKKFSKLSYRDLYKSLSLWDKVEAAKVIKKELPLDPACAVGSFKLIGDKLLGVATIQTNLLKGETRYFDTIMYFDSDSLELISQETYPFQFDQYDENDKLIVLFEQRIRLHVIIKSNKCNFVYDIMKQYDYDVLSDNEIFFVNTNSVVCTARLKVVDGAETMETEKLTLAKMFPRSYYVVAFARVNENVVNILVDSGTKLLIYCCELKNLGICGEIDHSSQFSVISKLREFGFNWCNPYVFRTLRCSVFTTIHQMSFTESVSPRNHVAIVCTSKGFVNILKCPYLDSRELNFYNIRPSKICKIVNEKLFIDQLDVVEILNGHRIFVRAGYNIFVIDLIHEQTRRATKRRAATGTSTTKKSRSENKQ